MLKIKKNKLLGLIFFIILILIILQSNVNATGTSTSDATSLTFGNKYNQQWTALDATKYYYKINVTDRGIVTLNLSTPKNANGQTMYVDVQVITKDNKIAFDKNLGSNTTIEESNFHLGLEKGTYYITFSPVRHGAYAAVNMNFKLTFEKNNYCETEPNNVTSCASVMELNHMYQCYADLTDLNVQYRADRHAFKLTKGVKYRLYFENFEQLEKGYSLWQLYTSDNSIIYDWTNFDSQGYDSNGNKYFEFTCKKTDTYYYHTAKNSDDEISYKIGIYVQKTTTKDISKCTLKLSKTTYTYNGKSFKPSVTIKDGSKTLKSGIDYTVSYASGRKNVGKYKVTIKGKVNYTGTKNLYFTIKPKATTISKLTAGSKKITVKWKKQSTQTTGYQIQYSTSSKFTGAKTITVNKNKTTSKVVSKLSKKKKYYVRIRTYKTVNGTKYYSSWSSAKNIKTK